MRGRTRAAVVAAMASLALLATACGGGGTSSTPSTGASGSAGAGGGEISIRSCTPKNSLLPANTNEVCGGNLLDAVMSKLFHYNPDTAAPELDIAQSVESSDNINFTVKLKPDYKFSDGTQVKSKNFVDAWNFGAYGPNAQANSYFFGPIAGYGDTQCGVDAKGAADCKGHAPKAKTMSGLKVVDDTTFTIKTTEAVSNLPVRLGYTAFSPLPDSFFTDPEAFAKKPIGAGPFKVDSISQTEMVLSKNADYSGAFPSNVDKVTFRIYTQDAAAYADVLANNLDFTDQIPADSLVGDQYKTDLPDRNAVRAGGRFSWITFSPNDPQLKDNPALRKALSRAIDRDLIAKQIFNGTVVPADGWVPSSIDGYKADVCGDSCKFDAAAAKAAYDAAGGYKGKLDMTVNGDGPGNKEFAEAVCNSIKNTLGVDCQNTVTVDFATFQKKIDAKELQGMFRSGWQMDYPSIENFLSPIYSVGADSNWSKYANPDFAKLMSQAAGAKTSDEANTFYQQAEELLAKDFPTAPLWFPSTVVGWSDRVTDVKVTAFGTLDLASIKLK